MRYCRKGHLGFLGRLTLRRGSNAFSFGKGSTVQYETKGPLHRRTAFMRILWCGRRKKKCSAHHKVVACVQTPFQCLYIQVHYANLSKRTPPALYAVPLQCILLSYSQSSHLVQLRRRISELVRSITMHLTLCSESEPVARTS